MHGAAERSDFQPGGRKHLAAAYAGVAVASACIASPNAHPDSPHRDFKLGEVMGGVEVRIPAGG